MDVWPHCSSSLALWNEVTDSFGESRKRRHPGQKSCQEGRHPFVKALAQRGVSSRGHYALNLFWAVGYMEMNKLTAFGVGRKEMISTSSWCTINGSGWRSGCVTHEARERTPMLLSFWFCSFLGMGGSNHFWWFLRLFQFQAHMNKENSQIGFWKL